MDYRIGDERVEVGGVALECRWLGPPPGEAPTVVMLHEGLGCVALWRDFPQALAQRTGCGVFVYSRAGYGLSDPVALPRPLSYMQDEAQDVLPPLLEAIGFRRGLLLGHSDGASIAATYAGSVQDHRVRGLVLYAPHFFVEEAGLEAIRAARVAYETGDLKARLEKYHGPNVECAFRGWNGAWLDPGFRAFDILDAVAHIRVPVLIVQGRGDAYGTLAQLDAAEETAYAPVERVVIEACGHAPHLDQPEAALEATASFVERLLVTHAEAAPLTAG